MEYQVARILYQFKKLPLIQQGEFTLTQGGNVEFELFSFFETCYHLKDWISKESDYHKWSNVENFVTNSQALRICADICNTLKHRQVSRLRSKATLGAFSIRSTIEVGADGATVKIQSATLTTERGATCCFALANECIAEWRRYFQINKIDSCLNASPCAP